MPPVTIVPCDSPPPHPPRGLTRALGRRGQSLRFSLAVVSARRFSSKLVGASIAGTTRSGFEANGECSRSVRRLPRLAAVLPSPKRSRLPASTSALLFPLWCRRRDQWSSPWCCAPDPTTNDSSRETWWSSWSATTARTSGPTALRLSPSKWRSMQHPRPTSFHTRSESTHHPALPEPGTVPLVTGGVPGRPNNALKPTRLSACLLGGRTSGHNRAVQQPCTSSAARLNARVRRRIRR